MQPRDKPHLVQRHAAILHWRASRLSPNVRSLLWSIAAGMLLMTLNTSMRALAQHLPPMQTLFLRYLAGLLVMLPLVLHAGWLHYRPHSVGGQFGRGLVHMVGLCIWFVALPHISIADTTAIGFTTPMFVMLGAVLFFREPLRWERWLAVAASFGGVVLVLAPKLTGQGGGYALLMLASAPVFAGSFLLTKVLTRYERSQVIVFWQCVAITLYSLPLALFDWRPVSGGQWLLFALAGVLGTAGQFCLTRSVAVADLTVSQSTRFLDLVWASLLGWVVFGDIASGWTLAGGAVICAATLWVLQREARGPR